MSALTAAAAGRRRAEQALMTDACEIRMPAASRFNAITKANDITPGTVIYSGKCRVRSSVPVSGEGQVGESPVTTWAATVSIPLTAEFQGSPVPLTPDCTVRITASADPALVGKTLRVLTIPLGTHLTARRLSCEVYQG